MTEREKKVKEILMFSTYSKGSDLKTRRSPILGLAIPFLLVILGLSAEAAPKIEDQAPVCSIESGLYDLSRWNRAKNKVVIDIRRAEHFQKQHISGSLNLPSFSLKHRKDLRQSAVLIVGEPYQFRTTEQVSNELINAGVANTNILKFGILSAHSANLELTATQPASSLIQITPNILATELAQEHPLLVVPERAILNDAAFVQLGEIVRPNPKLASTAMANNRILVALSDNESQSKSWAQELQNLLRYCLEESKPDATNDAEPTESALIFYLEGGVQALESYISQHREILAQVRKRREPMSCR